MGTYNRLPEINGRKECGNCHQIKSISEFHKNRNRHVSKCKVCRKKYSAEYRQRIEVKKQGKKYRKIYFSDPKKREIRNERNRKRNKRDDVKVKRNSYRRDWAMKEKQKAIDYKGGKCIMCGYSGCLAAMDFHHKNPIEKNGYGTGALKAHWTFEKNKAEIDKCILVCVRCHREIHAGVKTI